MGFLKSLFGTKTIEVDPADLKLLDEVATDKPGLTLRKCQGTQSVSIDIVGESFRSENVAAVAAAAQGMNFDIYLVNEPGNPHDKNAVAVYAANLPLGYIAKPANKKWFKWVDEAIQRGELLWGPARAVSRQGTSNIGIFGSILMPSPDAEPANIEPKMLDESDLTKAVANVVSLANSCDEPEAVAQLKSLCKKAVKVTTPIIQHAKWVEQNPDGQELEQWADILSTCDEIFSNAADASYATSEDEIDALSAIEELAELLEKVIPQT